jgi:hypothetical protein
MALDASRRELLAASLFAMLPFNASGALASPLDPTQTIIKLPADLPWRSGAPFPQGSVDMCPLAGDINAQGLYFTLVRWHPGFMSAPHYYSTDRFCVVVSGTWWVNSGADFDPGACVPVPAGSFVHRVAHTPHYDGVIAGHPEPVVIAICGIGPINFTLSDPTKPAWREL